MSSPRVVMVCGGGGAKAAAHLGVARALREAGIAPIRYIGTSMGAVMAAALATGDDPQDILARTHGMRSDKVVVPNRMALLQGMWAESVLRAEPVHRVIATLVRVNHFSELHTPCTVTAVEKETGREVAFGADGESAPLLDALAASCALPPYFPPVALNGRAFLDGGLRAQVPLHLARTIPCDVVIAVHAGPGFDETGLPVERPPRLIAASDTAMGWLMAGTAELMRREWELTAGLPKLVWIRPVHDRAATFALDRAPAYAQGGYDAMRRALEELR